MTSTKHGIVDDLVDVTCAVGFPFNCSARSEIARQERIASLSVIRHDKTEEETACDVLITTGLQFQRGDPVICIQNLKIGKGGKMRILTFVSGVIRDAIEVERPD